MTNREYKWMVWNLIEIVRALDNVPHTNGLRAPLAKKLANATRSIRQLTTDLTQDVAWPYEPGIPPEGSHFTKKQLRDFVQTGGQHD